MNILSFNNMRKSLVYNEPIINKNIDIIICEDDEISRMMLIKSLSSMGIKSISFFETTNKLHDYIKNLKNINKDTLLILDIKMPKDCIQGDELCRILRKEKINARIIAATGMKTKTFDTSKYIDNDGFDDVLFKPYSKNELIEIINNNINNNIE